MYSCKNWKIGVTSLGEHAFVAKGDRGDVREAVEHLSKVGSTLFMLVNLVASLKSGLSSRELK